MGNEKENQAIVGAHNEVNVGGKSGCPQTTASLHREFVKLSFDIIKIKNKLISLLLKIYEKEIYKEKGCRTIYEYGFKYAKLSKEVIDKALRTLKNVEDKPFLKQMIETQGIHKVSLVATLATAETDKMFAQHVENMSKPALFEFAKELRNGRGKGRSDIVAGDSSEAFGGLFGTDDCDLFGKPKKCQAAPAKMTIELDSEMQTIFFRLKHKYARNCSNKEAMKIMLEKLQSSFDRNDQKISSPVTEAKLAEGDFTGSKDVPGNGKNQKTSSADTTSQTPKTTEKSDAVLPSPHVPAKTKRQMLAKYHHKCAYPKCTRAAENIHHRVPFAFGRSHETIIPLCKIHHEFAHNGIIRYEHSEPENWKLAVEGKKNIYDGFRLKYRSA